MKHKHIFVVMAFALLSSHCAASCSEEEPKKVETSDFVTPRHNALRNQRIHNRFMRPTDGGNAQPPSTEDDQ